MFSFRRAPHRYRSSLIALATVAAALAAAPKASALQYYWRGGAYDNWGDSNWDGWIGGDYFFTNNSYLDDVYFGSNGYYDNNGIVNLNQGLTVGTLNFASQNWKINLSSVGMINGGINVASTSSQVDLNLTFGLSWGNAVAPGSFTPNVKTGSTLNIHGNVYGVGSLEKFGAGKLVIDSNPFQQRGSYIGGTNLYGGTLITDNPISDYNIRSGTFLGFNIPTGYLRGDLTFTDKIYGAGSFVKSGDATLTFAGDESYTGGTIVEGGRLVVATPWYSAGYTFNGGDLEFKPTTSGTYAKLVEGTGAFTKSGNYSLTLTGASNAAGSVSVTGGSLTESKPMSSSYTLSNGAALGFNISGNQNYFRGTIAGSGNFTKSGAGDLTFVGANSYTGTTYVMSGRLIDYHPHGPAYYNYSSLVFTSEDPNDAQTYDGTIIGSGAFAKSGVNTLTLTADYGNVPNRGWTSGMTVTGGRLIDLHPHGNYQLQYGSDLEFRTTGQVLFAEPHPTIPNALIPDTIYGTGNFTKSGAGSLILYAPLTYTGSTTVNGGELAGALLPSGTDLTVASGASFSLSGTGQTVNSLAGAGTVTEYTHNAFTISGPLDRTFSGLIVGYGSLVKAGTGTQTLSGVSTYPDGTTVNGGRLIDYNPHGAYVTNADLEFYNAGALGYATPITGTANFTKSGAGVLTLTGASTYSGSTTISAGTLKNGIANALPTGTALTVNGAYDLNGFDGTVGSLAGAGTVALTSGKILTINPGSGATYSGVMSGAGALTKGGAGTQTLSGVNTYSGGTTVNGGRLVVANLNGAYTLSTSTTLEAAKASAQSYGSLISGTGAFVKSGAGILTLTGANPYTGGTTVNGGRLIDQNPHGDYSVALNAALEFGTTGTRSFAGVASGSGSLTKSGAGTLTLTGANSYTGGTTVSTGRLIDVAPHGNYALQNGADVEFQTASDVLFAEPYPNVPNALIPDVIYGTGNFTKSGAGALILLTPFAYIGNTTVNGGSLTGANGVAPLPSGTNLTVASGATFSFGGANQTVNSLAGAGAVSAYTHNALTVNGALDRTFSGSIGGYTSLIKAGTGTQTLSGFNSYTDGTTVNGGRLIVANPNGSYVTNSALEFGNAGDRSFSGLVAGSGSLTKSGAGTLTLTGANTYTGGTTVSAGRLIDLNPHGTYLDNAALEFSNSTALSYAAPITGTGAFTKSGAGALTLTGANTYADGTIVNAGLLIDLNPHGNYLNSASLEFRNATAKSYAGVISGAGNFTKSGAGTLTLAGANTYTGATLVTEGRLIDQSPHGTYLLYGGTGLEFKTTGNRTLADGIYGLGSLTKSGAGTLTLTASYEGSFFYPVAGGITVNGGRLVDQHPHGAYVTNAALEFQIEGIQSLSDAVSGTGSLTKSGAGTLTLAGASTHSGGTTVNAGRLIDQHPHGAYVTSATLEFATATDQATSGAVSGSGTLVKSGAGTLALTGSVASTLAVQANGGVLKVASPGFQASTSISGGATLQFDETAADATYAGAISGAGRLVKSGDKALALTQLPGNAGGVRVSGGTLAVGAQGALSGGLSVESGATFRNVSGGALTLGGPSVNQGAVGTVSGATTRFTGAVSGAGAFTGVGTVRFDGGFSPGNSPASVTFQGDMALGAANDLTMELGGTTLGTGYDHLTVDGTAFLGGNLKVAYYNGFSAGLGQSFDLFDFAHETGMFASINLPTLADGLVWNTSALYTNGTIRVQSVPEPASLVALGLGGLALLRRRKRG